MRARQCKDPAKTAVEDRVNACVLGPQREGGESGEPVCSSVVPPLSA